MTDLKSKNEQIPNFFPFQEKIIGKNVHSVYIHCLSCRMWGIGDVLEKQCGNCGNCSNQLDCIIYYDAETIHNYLLTIGEKEKNTHKEFVDSLQCSEYNRAMKFLDDKMIPRKELYGGSNFSLVERIEIFGKGEPIIQNNIKTVEEKETTFQIDKQKHFNLNELLRQLIDQENLLLDKYSVTEVRESLKEIRKLKAELTEAIK